MLSSKGESHGSPFPMLQSELDEDEVLTYCALRFDGWAYEALRNHEGGHWGFDRVTESVAEVMTFPDDDLECLAAFFALQRYLCKWGGETLPISSREHIAYRLFFLHCYRTEIPAGLRSREWYGIWESKYRPRREECAAMIRNTMARRIPGPERIPGGWKLDDEHPGHWPE